MTALHVVVRPRSSGTGTHAPLMHELAALDGLLDIVVDGVNLTARVGAGQAIDFLIELSHGLQALLKFGRASVALHTEHELWELGMEADADAVLLSVFSPGPVASVAAYEKRVPLLALIASLDAALATALDPSKAYPRGTRLGLNAARRSLVELGERAPARLLRHAVKVSPMPARGAKTQTLKMSADLEVRSLENSGHAHLLERADLHSLLAAGVLRFQSGSRQLEFANSHVFLDSERLLQLAEDALKSWRTASPTYRRSQLTQARLSLRRGPGESTLELGFQGTRDGASVTWVLEAEVFVRSVSFFALSLAENIYFADPTQKKNLRLRGLLEQARHLLEQIDDSVLDQSVRNPEPDSYRRFAPRLRRSAGIWEQGPKMRFSPRWVAAVPGLDLNATFLCGDRLVIGGRTETACIDRQSGEVLWQKALRSAACVVTPSGLVRVEPDGRLSCHDLSDGELRFGLQLTPRRAGGAAGSVLNGAGLPKLLALCEGDRQITGIDLLGGAVRWRYTARRPAPFRLRRAGRLLIAAGGDPLLVALDGVTGEVVWTLRGRLPFQPDLALDHDVGFALSGSPGGTTRLHRFNPWSGEEAWSVELDERPLGGHRPLLTADCVVVPTFDQEGAGAIAYDRETGEKLWEQAPGLVSVTSAWLAVDDCIVANSASGVLTGLDARTGVARYTHVFSSNKGGDQPRRFEPVLRSGALFVPQHQVHVVRPKDGELLGTLPSDLIPDLIRVDERCDVYIAEDSGHVAAFGAAPRLSLVR